ncbi:MAG: amidohydrolase family protein, partial [Anaerolineae bacterium]
FHAIGDRAVREFLDSLERLKAERRGFQLPRPRLEHAQLIDPADIPRLARLGVVVSAQPGALDTPEKDAGLLGAERAARAYPYRALLDAGVALAFGSDMPGESGYNPLHGIHSAVNRPGPSRHITPLEALSAYTLGSAYAEFQEGEKGSIVPGKLADLAVLSADPVAVPLEQIRGIDVEMTMVGGKVVFEK